MPYSSHRKIRHVYRILVSKLLGRTGWRWDDSIQLDCKYHPQKRFNLWLAEGLCEL